MKNFAKLVVAVAVAALAVSCSLLKPATTASSNGPKTRSLNEAQEYALAAPAGVLRAVGTYRDIEEFEAQRLSTAIARVTLAENIAVQVKSGIRIFRDRKAKSSVTMQESSTKKEKGAEDKDAIVQLCEQAISGARAVKYSIVDHPNGEVEYFTCVEADAKSVAKYLANNSKVQDLISEDEAAEIEFSRDEFLAFMEEQLGNK